MEERVLGTCTACEQPIISGAGIHVDGERQLWHPGCYQPAVPVVAKRRGRPPKTAMAVTEEP